MKLLPDNFKDLSIQKATYELGDITHIMRKHTALNTRTHRQWVEFSFQSECDYGLRHTWGRKPLNEFEYQFVASQVVWDHIWGNLRGKTYRRNVQKYSRRFRRSLKRFCPDRITAPGILYKISYVVVVWRYIATENLKMMIILLKKKRLRWIGVRS